MKKTEEDDEDVPDPARVPEQRSHRTSTRSAATRSPARLGARGRALPGSPGAGLGPSGTLVIHRDAAAPGREAWSPPPTRDRPGRARRTSAANSDRGAPSRPPPPAGSRVRGARPCRTVSAIRASPSSKVDASRRCRRCCGVFGTLLLGRAVQPRLAPLALAGRPRRRSRPASARAPWILLRRRAADALPVMVGHVDHPRSLVANVGFVERRVYLPNAAASHAVDGHRRGATRPTGRTRSS